MAPSAPTAKARHEERFYPAAPSSEARPIELPVREVTVLEDRARVCRRATIMLRGGHERLRVADIAPVLQDVSLRGRLAPAAGRVKDLRVRRAMRIVSADPRDSLEQLEKELQELSRRFAERTEDRRREEQRYATVVQMLRQSLAELPEDACWGISDRGAWQDAIGGLSERARRLIDSAVGHYFEQLDIAEAGQSVAAKRVALDTSDAQMKAWVEVDLEASEAGEAELELRYLVPNALWRPRYSALLRQDGTLRLRSQAAVWQRTGEDWTEAELCFSTARSSVDSEPPLLDDDLLLGQRRSERIVVEQQEVTRAGGFGRQGGSGFSAASAVELPGADDGGVPRELQGAESATVHADGRLALIPIRTQELTSTSTLCCMPEIDTRVHLKTEHRNVGEAPLLAGPVELLNERGFVGWSTMLFVPPEETFPLGHGHDDALRVHRSQRHESETDADGWTHNDTWVTLSVSNLGGQAKAVELVERIPVSEIEHVRVTLDEEECAPTPSVDDDGLCRWTIPVSGGGHETVALCYRVSTAPHVEGM